MGIVGMVGRGRRGRFKTHATRGIWTDTVSEEEWFEFCIVVVEEVSNGFMHAHRRLF
jgi:hypothetical protein